MSAIAVNSGHVEGHAGLAQVYLRLNQQDRAREVLERGLSLQPNNPGLNYLYGKLELNAGNNEAALAAFNKGLATAPNDLDLNTGAGIANDMLGNHRVAQSIYTRAINVNKGRPLSAIRSNLAMSYLLSGEPKRALPLLTAEAKNPKASIVTRHNLALAYGMLGQPANAREALQGQSDEETRVATLARLKEYLAAKQTNPTQKPPVLTPTVKAAPVEKVETSR
jgi:Flp pilus assembly protein TadD